MSDMPNDDNFLQGPKGPQPVNPSDPAFSPHPEKINYDDILADLPQQSAAHSAIPTGTASEEAIESEIKKTPLRKKLGDFAHDTVKKVRGTISNIGQWFSKPKAPVQPEVVEQPQETATPKPQPTTSQTPPARETAASEPHAPKIEIIVKSPERNLLHQKYADNIGFLDTIKTSLRGEFGKAIKIGEDTHVLNKTQAEHALVEKGVFSGAASRVAGNLGQGRILGKRGMAIAGGATALCCAYITATNLLRGINILPQKKDDDGNDIDFEVVRDVAVPAAIALIGGHLAGAGGIANATRNVSAGHFGNAI